MVSRNNRLRSMRGRSMTVDFSQLVEFQEKLQELAKEDVTVFLKKQLQKIADEFYEKVVDKTPRKTGLLKSSWKVTKVVDRGDCYEVSIYNDAKNESGDFYALFVELGHRTRDHSNWVNGKFMMHKTILEIEDEMPKILERELKKFLEGKLNA